MENPTNKNTLAGAFGDVLPYKLVKSFIESPNNFVEIESILKPEHFSDAGVGLAEVVKKMKEFYREKGRVPGYSDLEYFIKDTTKDVGDLRTLRSALTKVSEDKLFDGIDTATEVGIDFIKKMEAIRQLENGKVSLKNSGYSTERLMRIIEGLQGIESGGASDMFTPISILDEITEESADEIVATGIDELDRHMNGGVAKGTTNLLLAGTGAGKTTLFSIMACRECLAGKKVLYLFFEDKNTNFGRKIYSAITGRYTNEYYKGSRTCKEAFDGIREYFKDHPDHKQRLTDNFKAVKLENGETTVDVIKSKVRRIIVGGWRPDVVFVDYLSCIKSSTNDKLSADKEYLTLDRCMKRLDAFAQEENFALWIAQQFNRDNGKVDLTSPYSRLASVQGSYRITQTASTVISLLRNTSDDDEYDRINLYLDKCRFSALGKWENAYMNNGNCQIDLSIADTDSEPFMPSKKETNKDEYDY